jgi:phosphoribosylanthranilate isomerase
MSPTRDSKRVITQIYEIQTPDEVERICALGVDHIGSVVLSGEEWQQPALRETVLTVQKSGKKSSLIPLFNDPETVFKSLDYYCPDIVHFCDMLSLDSGGIAVCQRLMALQQDIRVRYPKLAIMRSIPIGRLNSSANGDSLSLAELFQPVSDYFLTDTVLSAGADLASQPVEGFVGITGQTCHWETARELVAQSQIPVILAGGLSPENVYDGIRFVKPAGVDSCTCTNRLDGHGRPIRFQKDWERIKRFIEETRRAVANLPDNLNTEPLTGGIHS